MFARRLTTDEARERFKSAGLELLDEYVNQYFKVRARCQVHSETHLVMPTNIFKGQRLQCCGNSGRSRLHTGKVVLESTREKLRAYRGALHHGFGVKQSAEFCKKVSDSMKAASAASVDYHINKAATGKTAGKRGYFYIADIGDGLLKFGSIVLMSPADRMHLLRRAEGRSKLLMLAEVGDAGAYEAAMMNAHRKHWVRGERFSAEIAS